MKAENSKTTGSNLIREYLLNQKGRFVSYEELVQHTGMKIASVRSFCQQFGDALVPDEDKTGINVGKKTRMKDLVRGGTRGNIITPVSEFKKKKRLSW